MNKQQKNLLDFIVAVIELGDMTVHASDDMAIQLFTVEVLMNTEKNGVMFCDPRYMEEVLARQNWQ